MADAQLLISRFKQLLADTPPVPEASSEALPEPTEEPKPVAETASYVVRSREDAQGFETQVAFKQARVLSTLEQLATEVNDLALSVQHQTRFLTGLSLPLAVEPAQPPKATGAPGPMRPEAAARWLADMTGRGWTKHLLRKLSIALKWRAPATAEDFTKGDHRYFTEITEIGTGYPVSIYTVVALDHILKNVDYCWALATSKETPNS